MWDNETDIHLQEFTSDSLENEEWVRGNNKKELMTGIKLYNEEADHAIAVAVTSIVIHGLEIQKSK